MIIYIIFVYFFSRLGLYCTVWQQLFFRLAVEIVCKRKIHSTLWIWNGKNKGWLTVADRIAWKIAFNRWKLPKWDSGKREMERERRKEREREIERTPRKYVYTKAIKYLNLNMFLERMILKATQNEMRYVLWFSGSLVRCIT